MNNLQWNCIVIDLKIWIETSNLFLTINILKNKFTKQLESIINQTLSNIFQKLCTQVSTHFLKLVHFWFNN